MGDGPMQLEYATPARLVRSSFLGRVAMGCIVVSIASLILAINTQQGLAGLIAVVLGPAGLLVSLVVIFRAVSRTRTAWIAFWISLLYLAGFIVLAGG
jgi:hypothetical protein